MLGNWGQWSECTQCGKGVSTRKRSCLSAPAIACKENLNDQSNCAGTHVLPQVSLDIYLKFTWQLMCLLEQYRKSTFFLSM